MKSIYLAGSINGCSDSECNDWRSEVKRHYPNTIDPMVRDYRGKELECYKEIVELDKQDILNSDVVLVRYVKPSVGTSMEILFAHLNNKPVVVWTDPNTPISPWLLYHSRFIAFTLTDSLILISEII